MNSAKQEKEQMRDMLWRTKQQLVEFLDEMNKTGYEKDDLPFTKMAVYKQFVKKYRVINAMHLIFVE